MRKLTIEIDAGEKTCDECMLREYDQNISGYICTYPWNPGVIELWPDTSPSNTYRCSQCLAAERQSDDN